MSHVPAGCLTSSLREILQWKEESSVWNLCVREKRFTWSHGHISPDLWAKWFKCRVDEFGFGFWWQWQVCFYPVKKLWELELQTTQNSVQKVKSEVSEPPSENVKRAWLLFPNVRWPVSNNPLLNGVETKVDKGMNQWHELLCQVKERLLSKGLCCTESDSVKSR